ILHTRRVLAAHEPAATLRKMIPRLTDKIKKRAGNKIVYRINYIDWTDRNKTFYTREKDMRQVLEGKIHDILLPNMKIMKGRSFNLENAKIVKIQPSYTVKKSAICLNEGHHSIKLFAVDCGCDLRRIQWHPANHPERFQSIDLRDGIDRNNGNRTGCVPEQLQIIQFYRIQSPLLGVLFNLDSSMHPTSSQVKKVADQRLRSWTNDQLSKLLAKNSRIRNSLLKFCKDEVSLTFHVQTGSSGNDFSCEMSMQPNAHERGLPIQTGCQPTYINRNLTRFCSSNAKICSGVMAAIQSEREKAIYNHVSDRIDFDKRDNVVCGNVSFRGNQQYMFAPGVASSRIQRRIVRVDYVGSTTEWHAKSQAKNYDVLRFVYTVSYYMYKNE
ncbi:hypothetical protein CLF_109180, partial [Clonorchis sinensis]